MAKMTKAINWPRVRLSGSSQFQDRFRWYSLHESDFFTWTAETARTLKEQRPAGFDWESVAEELEDLGISEQRALESHLRVVLTHLLKWVHQPGYQSRSWSLSIGNARDEVHEVLERSPGLQDKIPALYTNAYRKARRDAAAESGLELDTFPPAPPWSYEQSMDDNFWPNASA
jgi:hypothetical protein